jgi:hypothetical protein
MAAKHVLAAHDNHLFLQSNLLRRRVNGSRGDGLLRRF